MKLSEISLGKGIMKALEEIVIAIILENAYHWRKLGYPMVTGYECN